MRRAFLFFLISLPAFARASPTPYADRLAVECDALLRNAIHRPYGYAWSRDVTPDATGKPTPRAVCMEMRCTPAAGFVLLLAGDQLHRDDYRKAAGQVARSLSLSQKPPGRINSNPIFSRVPIITDERAAVADRSATRCALGLLLALVDHPAASTAPADSPADPLSEGMRRSAARCTDWLAHQLTPNFFWPTAFPPEVPAQKSQRIVRLDDPDYRDSSIALLLAAAVLGDPTINRVATNPVDALRKVILKNDVHGPNLWSCAVTIDATGVPTDFPNGPDVLASRFCMQTMLAAYLLTGERADGIALGNAAATLQQCRSPDGKYDRFLDPVVAADVARTEQPPAATQSIFAPPATSRPSVTRTFSEPFVRGDFGVPSVVDSSLRLKELGREHYLTMLTSQFTLHQQLEACLCGLNDDPMTLTMPITAAEVRPYLAANAERFRSLDEAMPADLPGRVQRLWLLLIRVKMEAMENSSS